MLAPAIELLLEGFHSFRRRYYVQAPELLHKLTTRGQSPKVALLACCDSRVDPAIVLDAAPGELFVIRNVANLVPPCETGAGGYHGTSAALEFAVRGLAVEQIIVLGHAHCGGIRALMEGSPWEGAEASFIGPWIAIAQNARARAVKEAAGQGDDAQLRACERRGVVVSLENLMTFPWARERVESGKLQIHGWYFDLDAGAIWGYDRATDAFQKLA